jgi:hypothetical protein
MNYLQEIKPGDVITRMLAGELPIELNVTEVTDDTIYCGERGVGWKFDRKTGAEVDEDLNWGPPPLMTGSFIKIPRVDQDHDE